MKSVVFEGVRLMPGSESLELYHDKEDQKNGRKKLKAHMAELDRVYKKMEGRV